jgi:hypothetical protein
MAMRDYNSHNKSEYHGVGMWMALGLKIDAAVVRGCAGGSTDLSRN